MHKPVGNQPRTKATIAYFPAAFCALISLPVMFLGSAGGPAFYSFLPICFLFVAFMTHALLRRVEDLEQQLLDAKIGEQAAGEKVSHE